MFVNFNFLGLLIPFFAVSFAISNLNRNQAMTLLQKRRVALGSLFFLAGLCFASWASRIPDIQVKFDLSESQLGSLLLGLPVGFGCRPAQL